MKQDHEIAAEGTRLLAIMVTHGFDAQEGLVVLEVALAIGRSSGRAIGKAELVDAAALRAKEIIAALEQSGVILAVAERVKG